MHRINRERTDLSIAHASKSIRALEEEGLIVRRSAAPLSSKARRLLDKLGSE